MQTKSSATNFGYTLPGIGLVYSLISNNSFAPNARLAGARAILRNQVGAQHNPLSVKRKGGLHPMYMALHGPGESDGLARKEIRRLLDESCKDIFDAVCFCTYFTK